VTPRQLYDAAVLGRWPVSVPIADPPRVVVRDRSGEVRWPAMPGPRTDPGLIHTTSDASSPCRAMAQERGTTRAT
jgi:hypothetical protein